MAELRLDNYGRARKNAEFVSIELDRIEGKIQALAEMAVNRQDPDFLSSQVDSAAESMRQTEKAVSELQHLTGLADQLDEPPADPRIRPAARSCANDALRPTRRRPQRICPDWFPPWAAQLAELYFSGTTAAFVLHGNTYDLLPHRRRARRRGTAGSPSSSPSSCSAAGPSCCTTTSAAACAPIAGGRRGAARRTWSRWPTGGSATWRRSRRIRRRRSPCIDRFVRNNIMAAEEDRV